MLQSTVLVTLVMSTCWLGIQTKNLDDDQGITTIYAASNIRQHVPNKLDIILNELVKTRKEIRSMGNRFRPARKCESRDERTAYSVLNCGNNTGPVRHHYVVDGDYNYQEGIVGVCRVIVPTFVGGKRCHPKNSRILGH